MTEGSDPENGRDELLRYAAAVRAALDDVPARERADLLEDLEDHLREVAAEPTEPLEERLGSPEDYAAELRGAYYGVDARDAAARSPGLLDGARALAQSLQREARDFWLELRAFPVKLRPAWWVLRGYLAVVVLASLMVERSMLLPPIGAVDVFVWCVAVLAGVTASVYLAYRIRSVRWFGPRGAVLGGYLVVVMVAMLARGRGLLPPLRLAELAIVGLGVLAGLAAVAYAASRIRPARWVGLRKVVAAGNLALLVLALGLFHDSYQDYTWRFSAYGSPRAEAYVDSDWMRGVTNIYPYTRSGKPLHGVLLYDQNGDPLRLFPERGYSNLPPRDAKGRPVIHSYPMPMNPQPRPSEVTVPPTPYTSTPGYPPRQPHSPGPSASRSASASPEHSVSPSPGGSVSPSSSPS